MILLTSTISIEEPVDLGVLESFIHTLPEKGLRIGIRVLLAVLALIIGIQMIRFIRKIVKKAMDRRKVDISAMRFTDSFIKYALYFLLITCIASGLGVDAASIVAILGSAGVAIGLALQGSLSNLAGGVLLLSLKPFVAGDYIEDSKGNVGTVTAVDLFYTELTTMDNKVISLPNGALANGEIINYTKLGKRRVDVTVGISYDSDIGIAKNALKKVLEEDAYVLKDCEQEVYVKELADSAVVLGIRCWVKSSNYVNITIELMEKVKAALDLAQIRIPFPQMDIHTYQVPEKY